MTDKQIIIYKKECYNEPHCSLNQVLEQLNAYKMEADEGKEINAELKAELKAKEQECEELKRQRQADKGLITSTGKMNYQLIQEYDKLKTENDELKETFDGLFKVQYKLADNNKKLRQCLTEIKEIGKKSMREGKMLSGGWLYQFIEQKISECEVGNDETTK